ncbi:MAG: dihydrolipoyl dehydrogenase [Thermodesulfobacteriota bacterium]
MAKSTEEFDLAIVGAGPGGYVAAIRAAQLGMSVALIENDKLGGACLNLGCIPSKALLRNAEILSLLKRAKEFGISFQNLKADYGQAFKRSRKVVSILIKGVEFLLKKNKVKVYSGTAGLISSGELEVSGNSKGVTGVKARRILLASGSRPKSLPGIKIDGNRVLSSDETILKEELPASILIIGAGAIGAEFAYLYAAYGVKVTLLEVLPQVLPVEDKEISEVVRRAFTKMGIAVLIGHKLEQFSPGKQDVTVKATGPKGTKEIKVEQVLVAVGRAPATDIPGLDSLGVAQEKGAITVDKVYQTNVPGLFALGDLTGPPLLAHKASAEGVLAVEAMAGKKVRKLDYANIPGCTYCQPQVASLGLTEEEAQAKGYQIKVGRFPFRANGKALALGEIDGLVKIIAEAKYGEILGVHMVGAEVTEMITEMALARTLESTPQEIWTTVHPHPSLSEACKEAAEAVYGQAIHIWGGESEG